VLGVSRWILDAGYWTGGRCLKKSVKVSECQSIRLAIGYCLLLVLSSSSSTPQD